MQYMHTHADSPKKTGMTWGIWVASQRTIACIALIACSPVMGAIAVAIKAESEGPVLFRQRRPGFGGREIVALKFRTMRTGSEKMTALGVQNTDPRVTRVGRVLRMTKLDELPQLWNIARGDMPFVGPRPIPHALNDELCRHIRGFDERYLVVPGLTSLSQVCVADNGLDERLFRDWSMRFEAERRYIRNRSVGYDLIVLFLTALYIARKVVRR